MQMQALRWGSVRWTLASKCSMPGQVCRCLQTCWLHISAASWLWGEALKAAAKIDAVRGEMSGNDATAVGTHTHPHDCVTAGKSFSASQQAGSPITAV